MKRLLIFPLLVLSCWASAQMISKSIGGPIQKGGKYVFYLHGAVVTEFGNNAINQSVPEWGPYEYLNILDSIKKRGFNVISEQRQKGMADSFYVKLISRQVDTLLRAGVKRKDIVILGASAGWDIALHVSARLRERKIGFIVMGGCWPDSYKSYTGVRLYGRFLSIIEKTDPHQTCIKIFENRKEITSYKEIILDTGLSHGFIYKGYKEWLDPVVNWMAEK
jgi:hypothetical protein